MTSTPVTEVSNLYSTTSTNGKRTGSQDNGFGDIMNLTSYSNDADRKSTAKASEVKPATRVERKKNDVVKTQDKKSEVNTNDISTKKVQNETNEEISDAVNEAMSEAIKDIAEKLDVSEEEVVSVMNQLGMQMMDLFDTNSLTNLVTTLSGENDSLALITNEQLYETLQSLTAQIGDIKNVLCESLDISSEDMQKILNALKDMSNQSEQNSISPENILKANEMQADNENAVNQEIPEKQGMEIVSGAQASTEAKISETEDENTPSKENLQAIETVKTVGNETEDEFTGSNNERHQSSNRESQSDVNLLGQSQNTVTNQNFQVFGEESVTSFSQTSEVKPDGLDLIKQITDYMNLRSKDDLTEMEMQLHPETLGNLHLTITSKAGTIAATIETQNEAVKNAIEAQVVTLKENLSNQGIKVEAVEVTIASHEFERNLDQGGQNQDTDQTQDSKRVKKSSIRRIDLNESGDESGFLEEPEDDNKIIREMMKANGNTVDYTV